MSAADYRLMTEATGQRIAAALEALQLTGLGDPVTIPHGGTGATTAAGACESIGAVKKSGEVMTGKLVVNLTSNGGEADVEAKSTAGSIYLYSAGSNTGNRGIYTANADGTGKSVITIDQNNNITCNGNAVNVTGTVQVDHGGTGMTGVTNGRTTAIGNYISGGDIYVNWCKWGPVVSVSGWFPIGTDVPADEAFMTLPFTPIVYGAATAVNANGTASRVLYWNANEKKLWARDVALPAYWWYTSFTYMTNE